MDIHARALFLRRSNYEVKIYTRTRRTFRVTNELCIVEIPFEFEVKRRKKARDKNLSFFQLNADAIFHNTS